MLSSPKSLCMASINKVYIYNYITLFGNFIKG